MERNVSLSTDLPDFFDWLDHPNLVVHRHDGDEPGVGPDGGSERIEVDDAVGVNGEVGDVEALLLEITAGVEDALVLRLGGDDVALLLFIEVHDALDGDVVGLGGAGGEDDFLGGGVDEGGDLGAGALDGVVGLPAVEVGAGVGVAEAGEVVGEHGVEDTGVDGGGGLHVEVEGAARDLDAFH